SILHSCFYFFKVPRPFRILPSFPTRRSSDLTASPLVSERCCPRRSRTSSSGQLGLAPARNAAMSSALASHRLSWRANARLSPLRSEEHTSELQSQSKPVCRLLLEKKNFL